MITTVKAFRGECSRCRLSFALPWLSDFAYGTFLFTRTDGKAYRLFEAIDHPVYRLVSEHVSADCAGEVAAQLSDRDGNFGFTTLAVCPRCTFHEIVVNDSLGFSDLQLPEASFVTFEALSSEMKKIEIARAAEVLKKRLL